MPGLSSTQIPKPKNWQDFERDARILFGCIWKDPQTQNNGSPGQRQHGVDIYGYTDGKLIGVQCKGKDADYNGKVTEKELRNEVEKTKGFTPQLSYFTLVTTAAVDAKIQEVARKITEELKDGAYPLSVAVWGWGELETNINKHPLALQTFHPDLTPYTEQLIDGVEDLGKKQDEQTAMLKEQGALLKQFLDQSSQMTQRSGYEDNSLSTEETVDKNLHAEIDGYRDLIKDGKNSVALHLLAKLKERIWDSASNRIKFRILTNMSAATSPNKESEAAELLLEAKEYQPDDKLALANVALAYLLKKDSPAAIKAANLALERDPANEEAAAYLVQALGYDKDNSDPALAIPKKLRDSAYVISALIYTYRAQENGEWKEMAVKAISTYPDNPYIRRTAAEADIDNFLSINGFLLGQKPTMPLDINKLEAAASTLQELWDKEFNREYPNCDASLPYNLIQAYRTLNAKGKAQTVLQQAIQKLPDREQLYMLQAGFHLENNQPQEAVTLLEKIPDNIEAFLLCNDIKSRDDPKGALESLETVETANLSLHDQAIIIYQKVDVLLQLGEPQKALDTAEEFTTQNPKDISALMALAWAKHGGGNEQESLETLRKATSLVNDSTPFDDLFLLAKRFEGLESFTDVADLLNGRVNFKQHSPALIMLLSALINSDKRKEANDLVSALPKSIRDIKEYSRAIIILHYRRGDFPAALARASHYLEEYPDDLRIRLYCIDIYLKNGDTAHLKKLLDSDVEGLKGSAHDKMQLAIALDRLNYHERALKLAYETQLLNPDNAKLQAKYIGLLLRPSVSKAINISCTKVAVDTAFTIEDQNREAQTFVIEPDEKLRNSEEVIAPSHTIATKALGLKVDETFKASNSEGASEWKIKVIKHKYIHALHTRMNRHEFTFPDDKTIQSISIKVDGEKAFQPLLDKAKQRHDSGIEILNVYRDSVLPLGFFADTMGSDVIEVWSGLASTGYSFKACIGNTPEREAAFQAIALNNKSGCVVDALTLHIIYQLEIAEAIAAVCGAISTTESIKDVFRARHEELLIHGAQPYMTVGWHDGRLIREDITSERLEQAINYRETQLDWVRGDIESIPAESDHQFSDDALKIKEAIGLDFLDPIYAAESTNRLLLCEDLSYRQFAAKEASLRTAWLQPVLMIAKDTKAITESDYYDAIYHLLSAGHHFTSIDSNTLFHALSNVSEWKHRFNIIANALFATDAEPQSHIIVMFAFFDKIWRKGAPTLQGKESTSILLRRFFFGEWQEKLTDVSHIKRFKFLVEEYGKENPEFWEYLIGWIKGHFLVEPSLASSKKVTKKKGGRKKKKK